GTVVRVQLRHLLPVITAQEGGSTLPEITEITAVIEKAVAGGRIPGAVVVARSRGEVVHRGAHGVLDPETSYPLQADSVLWLASLSKPVGAAGLLILAEEGRLSIDDPVSRYIAEFGIPGRVRELRPGSPSPITTPFGPPPDPLPQYEFVPAEREL